MKRYKNMLKTSVFITLLLFSSCQKDPFLGTDNYITDFAFLVNGDNYSAIIDKDDITVNIPSNISLKGATVKYLLSERATITPKPESITDWQKEQMFTVTSYNGQERKYTVNIIKENVILKGDVKLISDKDVEEFAARGINIIDGNLIIGTNSGIDSISNIDALQCIKEVSYNIVIGKTFKGESLNGLQNLIKAGGVIADMEITFEHNRNFLRTIELPSLEKVFGDIRIVCDIMDVISFPKLTTVENLFLHTIVNKEINLNQLQIAHSIDIDFELDYEIREIKHIDLPQLIECSEKISIASAYGVERISFPLLESAKEFFVFNMTNLKELKADKLKTITEKFIINSCNELKSFESIGNIEQAANIEIGSLNKMENFQSLFSHLKNADNLTIADIQQENEQAAEQKLNLSYCSISESINISGVWLSEIDLPPSYKGKLFIYPFYLQTDFPVIKGHSVGSLELTGFNEITSFIIPELATIEDNIHISSFDNLEVLNMSQLKGKIKKIEVSDCPLLKEIDFSNISEAQNITVNGENIEKIDMRHLSTVNVLDLFACPNLYDPIFTALNTIKEKISIGDSDPDTPNEALTNLNGFSSLSRAGFVEISFCLQLTDYSGLRKAIDADGITADKWEVHDNAYNPTFEELKAGLYIQP